jgi:D-arginine dehydrogenase
MVIGEDPDAPGFFWLVGQGGTGIETAPAAAQLLASLVTRGEAPDHLAHLDLPALTPGRLR